MDIVMRDLHVDAAEALANHLNVRQARFSQKTAR